MNCGTRTACGVDSMLVVCSYPATGQCFYPSGPCAEGKKRQPEAGEVVGCVGSTAYTVRLPPEMTTRLETKEQGLHKALSLCVESLCTVAGIGYSDHTERYGIFLETLKNVRRLVGAELRLTSMPLRCAWCEKPMGTKEGNGAIGESATICPDCYEKQLEAEGLTLPPDIPTPSLSTPPRPWTPELRAIYEREMYRQMAEIGEEEEIDLRATVRYQTKATQA